MQASKDPGSKHPREQKPLGKRLPHKQGHSTADYFPPRGANWQQTMISYEIYCRIKFLHQQEGLSTAQIGAELGLDPRTVLKYLEQANFTQRQGTPRKSKLGPYKLRIKQLLEAHEYSSVQIFQRLREEGFPGGYSTVKNYLHLVRPRRSPAFLTLSFAPGECAQVDWGQYGSITVGSTSRKLSFFVMVLCYSRMMYLEFTVRETMEHFLACHENAFQFFGGAPKKVMTDNLRAAVLKRHVGKAPVYNPRYLDFANHYGFTVSACNVRSGNEKGRVENGVGYVKKNLLNGLDIPDFAAIHPAARLWLETIANVRIHGETKKQPVELFALEKSALRALPIHTYDCSITHNLRASSRFRITFDTNRYSVPAEYASKRLIVKTYPDRICCYAEQNLVARHTRSYDRHQDIELPDHPRELLEQRRKADDQKLYARFLAISPKAEQFYRGIEALHLHTRTHMHKILALVEIYGNDEVARAIEDAFIFRAFSSDYIMNICQMRARKLPEAAPLQLTRRQDLLELELPPPDLDIYKR